MSDREDFIPALGHKCLTWAYDLAIALLTREARWRSLLVQAVAPQPGDIVVDVGCGTASLALMLKRRCPQAHVIGLDPDPQVLRIARRKAERARLRIELVQADAEHVYLALQTRPNKIVSSLVLHHLTLDQKRAALRAMFAALQPGGRLTIADYGLQRTWVMRRLFRLVQHLDGFETTQPNADGILPALIAEAGFDGVAETAIVRTPTGSISLYQAHRRLPAQPCDAATAAMGAR